MDKAARYLGLRMMREGGDSCQSRLTYGFRLAVARQPDVREHTILMDLFQSHLADFEQDKESAAKLLKVGDARLDDSALTVAANR